MSSIKLKCKMLKSKVNCLVIFLLINLFLATIAGSERNQQVRLSKIYPESLEFFSTDTSLTIPLISHSLANTKASIYTSEDTSILPKKYAALDWNLTLTDDNNHQLGLNLKRLKNQKYKKIPAEQYSRELLSYNIAQQELYQVLSVARKKLSDKSLASF